MALMVMRTVLHDFLCQILKVYSLFGTFLPFQNLQRPFRRFQHVESIFIIYLYHAAHDRELFSGMRLSPCVSMCLPLRLYVLGHLHTFWLYVDMNIDASRIMQME